MGLTVVGTAVVTMVIRWSSRVSVLTQAIILVDISFIFGRRSFDCRFRLV